MMVSIYVCNIVVLISANIDICFPCGGETPTKKKMNVVVVVFFNPLSRKKLSR